MLMLMRLRNGNAPSAYGYGVPRVSAAKERGWYMTHTERKRSCVPGVGAECVAGSRILLSGTICDSTPLLRPSPHRPLMTNVHRTVKNFCCSG